MSLRWPAIYSAAIVFSAGAILTGADAEPPLKRFEKEALPAWAHVEQGLDGWEGNYTSRDTFQHGHESRTTHSQRHFCLRGPLKKFESERVPATGAKTVFCFNGSYGFKLSRNPADRSLWVEKYDDTPAREWLRESVAVCQRRIEAALAVPGDFLPTVIENGSYRILKAASIRYRDRDMVRIDFSRPPEHAQTGDSRVMVDVGGWAILDPSADWIVYEAHQTRQWGESRLTNEFQFIGGVPFPRKILDEDVDKDGKVFQSTELIFDAPHRCEAPEADFRLANYGLPEMRNANELSRFSNARLWLIVNGIVVLGLACAVCLRRRRKLSANARE